MVSWRCMASITDGSGCVAAAGRDRRPKAGMINTAGRPLQTVLATHLQRCDRPISTRQREMNWCSDHGSDAIAAVAVVNI